MLLRNTLLLGLLAGSVLMGLYEALFYWRGVEPASVFISVWPFVFVVLLVLWLEEDSRLRPNIYRPFEFGYLLFFLWLPYLPYYLWRTRGWAGLLMFVGFVALAFLGQLLMWGIYVAR